MGWYRALCFDVSGQVHALTRGQLTAKHFPVRATACTLLVDPVVQLAPRLSKVPLFNAHAFFSGFVY